MLNFFIAELEVKSIMRKGEACILTYKQCIEKVGSYQPLHHHERMHRRAMLTEKEMTNKLQ